MASYLKAKGRITATAPFT